MEIILVETEDFLCDHYRLKGNISTESVLALLEKLESDYPDFSFLVTLDDFAQASYTSAHTKMLHDLDETEGYDLTHLPEHCFEDGEHKGYLTTKEELFIRKANIEKHLKDTTFDDVYVKQVSLFNEDDDTQVESFKYDLASLIEGESYILKVPVETGYEAAYAFPNGYFSCDLSPMENALLARVLYEKFGYNLIGIGASYLAFKKTRGLTHQEQHSLINLLNKVYIDEFDAQLKTVLFNTLSNNQVLILKYTE